MAINRPAPALPLTNNTFQSADIDVSAPYADQNAIKPLVVEYLHIIRRRKWWIAAVLVGFVMLALVATLLMRPVYTASTQIEVSRDQKNVTSVQGVDSTEAGRDQEFYQTQYSLLEARSLAERVISRLKLDSLNDFWEAHGVDPTIFDTGLSPTSRRIGPGGSPRETAAVELLLEHVSVAPIRGSSLIDIEYSSYSPDMSARIANTWANEFIAQSIARKFDSTTEARSFLERRLGELRDKVQASERALVDFATAQNIVTIDGGNNAGTGGGSAQFRERTLAADSLEQLNDQLQTATAARIEAQALARASGGAKTNATLASLRQQRAIAAAEYAELMVQFEPGYPSAQALKQQINELDRAILTEESRITRDTREQFQAASAREAALRSRVADLSGQVQGQRRASIQYNTFQREADTNRQLYDSLLQRYKEIGVAGVSANNIAIIDLAQPPSEPSSPNLLINLLFALAAGLVAALALVFILEQTREGLTDPTRAADLLGIPLLGSVPKADNETDISDEISDPKSVLSEAYLAIRSSLAFTTQHGVPRSLMVVSSQPAEGKSTTALALANVFSRVGKRVVLIDCDLRNPSIHSYLGVGRDQGVSNYLAGNDAVDSLIQKTDLGFDFIATGPTVPSAAELLSSDRLAKMVQHLETKYDHVIVDSAPVIGLADAPLVSRTVEAVIFVVETGAVSVRGLQTALNRLRAANAPLIGTVMTKFDEKNAEYGYGYSYDYNYGLRSREPEPTDA